MARAGALGRGGAGAGGPRALLGLVSAPLQQHVHVKRRSPAGHSHATRAAHCYAPVLIVPPLRRLPFAWRQVVDARDPLTYRSEDLASYALDLHPTKRSLLLLNKADLLPEALRRWEECCAIIWMRGQSGRCACCRMCGCDAGTHPAAGSWLAGWVSVLTLRSRCTVQAASFHCVVPAVCRFVAARGPTTSTRLGPTTCSGAPRQAWTSSAQVSKWYSPVEQGVRRLATTVAPLARALLLQNSMCLLVLLLQCMRLKCRHTAWPTN